MKRLRYNLSAYFVLLVALSVTGLASYHFVHQTRQNAEIRFEKATANLLSTVKERLNLYSSLLLHTRAIFQSQPRIHPEDFHQYFESLGFKQQYPGATSLAFAPRISQPEGHDRFAIGYVEPFNTQTRHLVGLNASADLAQWQAMERARDTGQAAVSSPVLVHSGQKMVRGFIVVLPLYKGHLKLNDVYGRRKALSGFLYLSVSAKEFFDSLMGAYPASAFDFEIFDKDLTSHAMLLYDRDNMLHSSREDRRVGLRTSEHLNILGRDWTINSFTLPAFANPTDSYVAMYVLLAGILVSSLLFGIVWSNKNQSEIERKLLIQAQQAQKEAEAAASRNSLLAEASKSLFTSFDSDRIFTGVSKITVPAFADGIIIDMLEDEHSLRRHIVRHSIESKSSLLASVEEDGNFDLERNFGVQRVVKSGQPLLIGEFSRDLVASLTDSSRHIEPMQKIGLKSLIIVPVPGREGVWGAVTFALTESRRRFDVSDLNFAEEIGRRMGLALDHAYLYKKSEEANRAKTNFLANMSHEIRTPLGAILGYTDLLKSPKCRDNDKGSYLTTIQRNGRQLARLIDELLDLSKIESGRLMIERTSVSISDLIQEIVQLLEPQARSKNIALRTRCEGPIPSMIDSDPLRLRQILVNIVGNAIKFTEQGAVEIEVGLDHGFDEEEDPQLCVKVHDTGIGITRRQSERLFHAFTQADNSTSRRFGGTGLGLVLSKRLAQALGGDLVLERSEPGRGSTFTLVLNLQNLEGVEMTTSLMDEKIANEEISLDGSDLDQVLKNVRVLVVEDSPDNQMLIQQLLTIFGAQVDIANDGFEGISKAQSSHFDVVLMDVQMPRMDGCEATRRLRRHGYKKPILALTAHAMREERERCLRSGCNDHLTKPIDAEGLVRKVAVYARQLKEATNGRNVVAFANPPSIETSA